jgi:insulysin
MRFHREHYSANLMKVVVLGRESLDTLQEWVEELFSPVENKNLPQNRWDGASPFTDKELGMQIFAKPVFDMRTLDFYFPYPDEENLYEAQPGGYLSHLIGHEGPGSILAYLKNKGWANGLGAGTNPVCPGDALFSISIRLTEDGLKHYQDVTKTVFEYIAMLKEQKLLPRWVFEEIAVMSEVDFRFKQKSNASKTTSALSAAMQRPYDRDHIISGPAIVRKFDPEAIQRGLRALNPDNFRLTLVSQEYPGNWDKREKYYGTEYRYEEIPVEFRQQLQQASTAGSSERPAELHLPHVNEFIPDPASLDVEKKEGLEPLKHPKLIRHDERVRIWFKKDDRFWVPKANLHVTLRSPLVALSPYTMAIAQLYQALVQDSLIEYSYAAEIAGLEYSLSTHTLGLDITIAGYNDKMIVLLEKVLKSLRDLEVRTDRFDIVKERLMRGYRNWDYQQPYYQIGAYTRWLQHDRGWINEQYAAELPHITEQDVRSFKEQLLRQLHIEVLAHGNLHKEHALNFTNLVESVLRPRRLPSSQWPIRRSLIYPPGSDLVFEKELKDPANVNHCVEYLLYCGSNQDRDLRAHILLFAQLAREKVFDTLRTKEQLGYVVFGGESISVIWAGYRILIQSEKHPEFLEKRIDAFLEQLGKDIEEMPEAVFEKHKNSIINKRLERLKNLTQESNRFWNHLVSEGFDFEQGGHRRLANND